MRKVALSLFGLFTAATLTLALPVKGAAAMQWSDLTKRHRPQPNAQITYGIEALQHVDVWLPEGKAIHPVVLMVHGGCWQTDVADASLMNYIAGDLRSRGIAVWNIEYRGVDRPGGGYPGTFLDAASAADALASRAKKYRLNIKNVIALGHSAGGHLALWLAARERIPKGSALYKPKLLSITTAISVGGLPDLKAAQTPPGDTCGVDAVRKLTGKPSANRRDVYYDTSPPELMPFSANQVLINATLDFIAPPSFADAYEARAKSHKQTVRRVVVPEEGHVELIAPGTASWAAVVREIERALHLQPTSLPERQSK